MTDERDEKRPALQVVLAAEELARSKMSPMFKGWRRTIDAFLNKGSIYTQFQISIKTSRFLSDLETIIPRDAMALLGSRPYFPYEARLEEQTDRARVIEDIVDVFTGMSTPTGKFFLQFCDALRMCRAFGIAYIEPRWSFWPVSVVQRIPKLDPMTEQVVGMDEFKTTVADEGIAFKVHDPWSVLVHPYGNTLDQKPWVIIKERTPVSEIERLIDTDAYEYTGKSAALRDMSAETHDFERQLHRELGLQDTQSESDIGMLMRYYQSPTRAHPQGREIHIWNYKHVLRDRDRSDSNLPLFKKPVVALRNIAHIGPDRYWPLSLWDISRDRIILGDHALSLFFDQSMQNAAQWLMYDPDRVEEAMLEARFGARVPVPGGNFGEAVQQLKVGQSPEELLQLYDLTDQSVDRSVGNFDYQRGNLVITRVGGESKCMVRVYSVISFILKSVGFYLISKPDAASLLPHIKKYARFFLSNVA